MDRYTIAGVLQDVQSYYGINDSQAGLLQISFIVSYMTLSPVFGYLGDRYNRKNLMAIGILIWSFFTLASSFVPSSMFWLFVVMRILVGVGEASYSTIAPTIIADLFVLNKRSIALSVFYFAIPVGGGLGYIVGSKVAELMGSWQWALRVTFLPGIVCTVLIFVLLVEPVRGAAEGACQCVKDKVTECKCGSIEMKSEKTSTLREDLVYLLKNKSFILSTAAFTCVTFVTGALAFWAPSYIRDATCIQGQCIDTSTIGLIFGAITCLAGLGGVGAGLGLSAMLRRHTGRADPLICGVGLILSAPFLWAALYVARQSTSLTWVLIFFAELCLCVNWAIVTDILLYIIVPHRRSTAEAFQILFSHALGDAISPYLIGVVSDYQRSGITEPSHFDMYISRQYALYMTIFVAVVGGAFFLLTAIYVKKDRRRANQHLLGEADDSNGGCSSSEESINNVSGGVLVKNSHFGAQEGIACTPYHTIESDNASLSPSCQPYVVCTTGLQNNALTHSDSEAGLMLSTEVNGETATSEKSSLDSGFLDSPKSTVL